jgi:hypothetical protein
MSGGFLWLAAFLLLMLPGLPLLWHRTFGGIPVASRAILAGAVGSVLVSFAMTLFALLGVPWHVAGLLLTAMFLAFALRLALPREGPLDGPHEPPRTAGAAAGLLSLLGVLLALAATAGGAASSPDLVFFWGPKAQQYALARTVDAGFLGDEYLQYMHAYYPPLVTNLYAFASMVAGRLSWVAATLTFPLLLAALALGLPGLLRTRISRPNASAAAALIVCAIAYAGIEADIGGNAEMALLFFETLAMSLLLGPAASGAATQLLAGLLLAGIATTKVEGLPFVLASAVLFLLLRRRDVRPAGSVLALFGPTVLALSVWFAFGATRHLFFGYAGQGSWLDLRPGLWKIVLRSVVLSLGSTGHGLPYLVPLACLLLLAPGLTRVSAIPLGVAAALAGFLLFTYLDRPGDPSQWISWSAPRVLLPLAMLFALAATCLRGDATGQERRTRAGSPG